MVDGHVWLQVEPTIVVVAYHQLTNSHEGTAEFPGCKSFHVRREKKKPSASSFPVTTQRVKLETGVSMQDRREPRDPLYPVWIQAHRRGGWR
jgi:hypothetical protein